MVKSINRIRTKSAIRLLRNTVEFRNFGQYAGDMPKAIQIVVKNKTATAQPVSLFKEVDPSRVEVTSSGGSYVGLLKQIIATPFEVTNFNVEASSRAQMQQPVTFTYRNEFGAMGSMVVIPSAQKSMWQKVPNQVNTLGVKMYVTVDGSIDFTLLPNEEVVIIMKLGKILDPSEQLKRAA